MSRRINVNPAHYKVAGRERQGEDIVQSAQKHAFGQQHALEQRWQAQHGGAPWETTPPAPLVDSPEERERAEQAERRAATRASRAKKTAKRGRKTAAASKGARKAKPMTKKTRTGQSARRAATKRAAKPRSSSRSR